MVLFGFIAAVFVVVALLFVMLPLLRQPKNVAVAEHSELTVDIYSDQLAELENDLKNETISQEQYDSAKADLERNLLEDINLHGETAVHSESGRVHKVAAAVLGVAIPVTAVALYGTWGAGEVGLDPEKAVAQINDPEHQRQNIEAMLGKLEARLVEQPNDVEGWFMLARSYQFLNRYAEAVKAFERVAALGGDQDPNVLASYADAVAMASGRVLTADAVGLLKKALVLDPFHVKSLWLVGTAAYQEKNYADALKYWERLLGVLQPGSQDHSQIQANITEVRSLLGLPAANPAPTPAPSQAQTATSGVMIKGRVELDELFASRASPDDTLFIFARAAEGPRMPLAIIRKQVKDLPMEFSLDDSMAMNPGMAISRFPRVVVGARISKSGNAMPQPGDLEGYSAEIRVGSSRLADVVIDSIVD